jgi:hypothetical protein
VNPYLPQPPTRSALTQLYLAVQRYFEAYGICAKVYLGLRERDRWDPTRVVIIDGEYDGSNTPRPRNAGTFGAPTQAKSYNPRELVSWDRPITISIKAADPKRIDDEVAQEEATEGLIEQTIQAIWNAMSTQQPSGAYQGIGQANIDWEGSKCIWVNPGSDTQQTWGKEFVFSFLYRCAFFDVANPVLVRPPALEKGPLLNNQSSGVNASIVRTAGPTMAVGNLGFCSPAQVGMNLVISGAAQPSNNGTFPIVFCLGTTSLSVTNASAVVPDANSGSISWAVVPAT